MATPILQNTAQAGDAVASGINSFTSLLSLDLIIKALLLYFFAIWIAFIVWATKDISNRTHNVFYQIVGILTIVCLTPIFGLPIYLLIRPRNTLLEKFYSDAQDGEFEEQAYIDGSCPYCQNPIEDDFIFCPHCKEKLVDDCFSCKKLIHTHWQVCPYCGIDQTDEDLKKKMIFAKKVAEEKKPTATETIIENPIPAPKKEVEVFTPAEQVATETPKEIHEDVQEDTQKKEIL